MNQAEPSGNRPFELKMPMQSVPSAEPQTKTPELSSIKAYTMETYT